MKPEAFASHEDFPNGSPTTLFLLVASNKGLCFSIIVFANLSRQNWSSGFGAKLSHVSLPNHPLK